MIKLKRNNCTTISLKRQPNGKYQGALRRRLEKMLGFKTKISCWGKSSGVHTFKADIVSDKFIKDIIGTERISEFFCSSVNHSETSSITDYFKAIIKQTRNGKANTYSNRTSQKEQRKESSVVTSPTTSISTSETPTEGNESGGGGDSDPDPDCPPIHLFNPHQLTSNTKKQQNRFYFSRRLASCQWLMAQGVA
jgi:hypothetical protein